MQVAYLRISAVICDSMNFPTIYLCGIHHPKMAGRASHRKAGKWINAGGSCESGNFPPAILQSRVKDKRVDAEFNNDDNPLFRSACFRHLPINNFPLYILEQISSRKLADGEELSIV